MPIYTFYPCRPDGSSATFEAFELANDAEAQRRALALLPQHPTCAFVTVWQGDREVMGPPQPAHAKGR
ncbi:hypothetical protein LJR225_000091 [Phenylobacterium sp. LjRoot225]|uniref:hypothetical protein n=1 Tax=Phenylobacterium sp. LjRoot225 TaxID=3342285 RepID=UPI003ED136B5